jgi:hypothetical protein
VAAGTAAATVVGRAAATVVGRAAATVVGRVADTVAARTVAAAMEAGTAEVAGPAGVFSVS